MDRLNVSFSATGGSPHNGARYASVEPFLPTPAPKKAGIVGCPPAAASVFFRHFGLEHKALCSPGTVHGWGLIGKVKRGV
jgi:hypothetical protein